ncbi:hypothetical protein OIO90_001326 [Microbotryomycetes sp. JL221]|nr:hypothetical protein OIO90_001326 [Microbotryomycetes sp. JL221]
MAGDDAPHISVALGIVVGLVASFIQSLGLTIQRKSHLANEAQPADKRKRDWKRPLWLAGFTTFIVANVFGTVFQIGALPIIVLGPLGAVSLLWNAFFARFILGDEFSIHLAAGIALIAGGACLIAIFGAVPEPTHTLDELVRLYRRPPFLIWISLLALVLGVTVVTAHVAEWTLERKIAKFCPLATPLTPRRISNHWRKRRCVLSPQSKTYGSVNEAAHSSATSKADGPASPNPASGRKDRHVSLALERPQPQTTMSDVHPRTARQYARPTRIQIPPTSSPVQQEPADNSSRSSQSECAISDEAIARSRLLLGVVYGSASGTLSGLCLLFTKTSVELLILTFAGHNQFNHVEAWLIVIILLVCELTQLWYLNRALRLIGPTLCCPLAYMAYALASMISGLIYYNQWDELSRLQFALVAVGTATLLTGVWTVSLTQTAAIDSGLSTEVSTPVAHNDGDEVVEEPVSYVSSDSEDEPLEWIPKGLSIGIAASSPGFDLRPTRHRRTTSTASKSDYRRALLQQHQDGESCQGERQPLLESAVSISGEAHNDVDHARPSIKQGTSLSGALYPLSQEDGAPRDRSGTELNNDSTKPRLNEPTTTKASFSDLEFSYPLKLIVPDRKFVVDKPLECVYVLSYGGGLVAGDRCRLDVKVDQGATLVMLTQGQSRLIWAL